MPRVSDIHLKKTYSCYTVSIRKNINFMEEYASFFEEALSLVSKYLDNNNILTSSPAMVIFHNMDLEHLDVEVGFNTSQKILNNGNILCKKSNPSKVISAIDRGPYEKQDPTLLEMFDYIKEHNLEMQGPIYYYYLNEPDREESEYLTQMEIPIK